MFGRGASEDEKSQKRFEELRNKYQSVLNLADQQHVQFKNLHVEDDKQHGDEVIPDAVAVARVRRRLDTALIRLELDLVVLLRLHQLRHHQGEKREPDGDQQGDEDRNIRVEHRVESDRRIQSCETACL